MEQGGSQTIASFTGTLLRRKHELGDKFVQLVFREDDHDVLCVSTNPQTAVLPVGQVYRVEGAFREQAGRAFVQDPRIMQLKKHWSLIKRLIVGVVVVGILGAGGTAFALHDHSAPTTVPPVPAPKVTQVTKQTPTSPVIVQAQPAPTTPAPVTHAVAVTKKPVVKTTAATSPNTPVAAQPTVAPDTTSPLATAPDPTTVDTPPADSSDSAVTPPAQDTVTPTADQP